MNIFENLFPILDTLEKNCNVKNKEARNYINKTCDEIFNKLVCVEEGEYTEKFYKKINKEILELEEYILIWTKHEKLKFLKKKLKKLDNKISNHVSDFDYISLPYEEYIYFRRQCKNIGKLFDKVNNKLELFNNVNEMTEKFIEKLESITSEIEMEIEYLINKF